MPAIKPRRQSLEPHVPPSLDFDRRRRGDHCHTGRDPNQPGGHVRVRQRRMDQIGLDSSNVPREPLQDAGVPRMPGIAGERPDAGGFQLAAHRPRRRQTANAHVQTRLVQPACHLRDAQRRPAALQVCHQ
jgi:hypothetical protein